MNLANFMLPSRLRKKDGYYHMIIDTTHPITSKVIRHSQSTKLKVENGTKKKDKEIFIQASNMLTKFAEDWTNHYFSNEKSCPYFTDYMASWLESLKPNLEYSTYRNYKIIVHNKVIPYFEPKKILLKNLKAKDIQEFYDYSLKHVTTNTVLKYHANIRKALETALKQDLVINNQASLVDKPKKQPFIASVLNPEQENILLEHIEESYLKLPVYFACFSGVRLGEATGLLWKHIDFEKNTIEIANTLALTLEDNKEVYRNRSRLKNRSSRRVVPLLCKFREVLLKAKEEQEANKKLFGNAYNQNFLDNVCVKPNGDPITPSYISKAFPNIVKKCNLPSKVTFHSLRHSFATILYGNGADIKSIQKLLGHAHVSTTLNFYIYLAEKHLFEIAQIIQDELDRTQLLKQAKLLEKALE